jgi:HSP20 family protein
MNTPKVVERKTIVRTEPHHDEIHAPISKHLLKELFEEFWNHRPHLMWGDVYKTPDVNLYRQGTDLILEAGLPGFVSSDLEVIVTDTQVTVKAEREPQAKPKDLSTHHYMKEIDQGKFYRSLELPVEVKSTSSEAEYKEGVLKIRMPLGNPEAHRPVFVKVK